jgi:hypothetical protein
MAETKENSTFRGSAYIGDVIDNFDNQYDHTSQVGKKWYVSLVKFTNQRGPHVRIVASNNPVKKGDKVAFVNQGGVIYASN